MVIEVPKIKKSEEKGVNKKSKDHSRWIMPAILIVVLAALLSLSLCFTISSFASGKGRAR